MKSSASLLLCSVLIFGAICWINVAAEDTKTGDTGSEVSVVKGDDDEPCIIQYLKSKGKLDQTFPSEQPSPLCRFTMIEVIRIVRDIVKDRMEEVLPTEANCFMTEYDKSSLLDTVLTIAIINTSNSLTETKKTEMKVTPLNEFKEQLKTVTNKCGIDDQKFESTFGELFDTAGISSKKPLFSTNNA